MSSNRCYQNFSCYKTERSSKRSAISAANSRWPARQGQRRTSRADIAKGRLRRRRADDRLPAAASARGGVDYQADYARLCVGWALPFERKHKPSEESTRSEFPNKSEGFNDRKAKRAGQRSLVSIIWILVFEIVLDFVLRISSFRSRFAGSARPTLPTPVPP